jgi:phosphopantothenate synthetase
MSDTNRREVAETLFERTQRREAEINSALRQEHARREAAVKNMYRLRALRLERDTESNDK